MALPAETDAALRRPISFHLLLAAVLIVGAAFADDFAWFLRLAGSVTVLLAIQAALFGKFDNLAGLPWWVLEFYPPAMAAFLVAYGLALGCRPSLALAALAIALWLTTLGWRAYWLLRQIIAGLDYLAASIALLAVAMLISLGKSGVLRRSKAVRENEAVPPAG